MIFQKIIAIYHEEYWNDYAPTNPFRHYRLVRGEKTNIGKNKKKREKKISAKNKKEARKKY